MTTIFFFQRLLELQGSAKYSHYTFYFDRKVQKNIKKPSLYWQTDELIYSL